jgi:hypothetical protein
MNVSATSFSSAEPETSDGSVFLSAPVAALLVAAAVLGFIVGAAMGLRKSSHRRVAPLPAPDATDSMQSADRSIEVVAARATPAAAVFGRSDVAVFSLSPLATPAFAEGPGAGCTEAAPGLGTIGEEAASLSSDA